MKNRREIIFLYDVKDANPNGDPDEGNRPRMDSEGYNVVTDVRLKRTVRDYWIQKYNGAKGKDVLVKRVEKADDKTIMSMGDLIKQALGLEEGYEKKAREVITRITKEVPATFADVRFFGAAITLKGANVSMTGPVQFGIGRSLNKPGIKTYSITTTFASSDNKQQGAFGETNVVDYSLLAFGGIVSETTAKDTGLSDEDLPLLWDGLWLGTKNLNTRSKFNHSPRLLMSVVSKESEFQVGGLYRLLTIEEGEPKDVQDVAVVADEFLDRLLEFKDSIDRIELKEDSMLTYSYKGERKDSLAGILADEGFKVESL